MTSRDFNQAARSLERSKQQRFPLIPGFLGFLVNGIETVEVPTRPGYVFVRLRGSLSEVVSAFNDEVSPVYGLPVLVTRDDVDNTRYKVISRDTGVYVNWGSASSYLPRHGDSHSFSSRAGTGGDVVWVYGRQMMPLNVIPSGTNAAGSVKIEEGVYYQAGAWHSAGGTGTVSFLPAKPSAGNARMMLLYLDENGNPGIATGTVFSESISGTSSLIPYIPTLSNNYYVPLAGIRLTSSTNTITWNDITDLRPWIVGDGFIPTGTFAPNSASYITVGSEAGLTAERRLTAGAGISITDNGANNTIVISSVAGGAGSYPAIYDDGVFKATGTAISFDTGLSVISSGTSIFVNSFGGGGGGGSTVIYDDGVYKTTGTAISFDSNLSVAVTGSMAFISATGGSGSKTLITTNYPTTSGTAFTSIPGTYTDLFVDGIIRSTIPGGTSDTVLLFFNNDLVRANYSRQNFQSAGTTNTGNRADTPLVGSCPGDSSPAGNYSYFQIEIPRYALPSFNKVTFARFNSRFDDTTHAVSINAIQWENTNPVTDLELSLSNGQFATGSLVSLWGIN